eukprot:scpid69859/ scgid18741/ 
MRNVEIKARLDAENAKTVEEICCQITGEKATILKQIDTFFQSANGRLKLRQLESHAELIYYERSDQAGPKLSTFNIHRVALPEAPNLCTMLSSAMGARGTVEKQRKLWLVGQTRVHLDHVTSLGWFMELEVVLTEHQGTDEGETIAGELMERLGIQKSQLISSAYIDLIEAASTKGT